MSPGDGGRHGPPALLDLLFRWILRLYPSDALGPDTGPALAAFRDAYRARSSEAGEAAARRRAVWYVAKAAAAIPAAWYAHIRAPRRLRGGGSRPARPDPGFHFGQALASLRRSPGYTLAFVVTFGLAVGVNSAVFSVVNGVLLKPLPFEGGERILYLKQPARAAGVENTTFSFMEIDDYRARATTIDEFVEYGDWEFTVLDDGKPHRALGGLVTSNFFGVLGLRPALGRRLSRTDDIQGAEPVMLLTHAYWDRVFGRDPSVVGRTQRLEDLFGEYVPVRVVGVLEPGSHYTGSRQPDFYVNYAANSHYQGAAMRDARGHRMTDVFARMAPGVTVAQARDELSSIAHRLHREYPEAYDDAMGFGLEVVPWQDELTRQGRPTFLFLMGAVGVILLLAAANVGNLTLTRLLRKQEELATRAALGASRTDLRLHLTAEHALLGLAGGALGLGLAYASRSSLVAYASRFTVRAQEVAVDWTVLGATLGAGVLLSVLLAWLPGLPVSPGAGGVASARSGVTDGRGRKGLQRGLVVTQLALSFMLLTGAGLLVRSMIELASVDPGFRTEQVLTLRTPTGPVGVPLTRDLNPEWERALDEIRAYPGVRSAAVATRAPLSAPTPVSMPTTASVRVDDEEDGGDRFYPTASNEVSPGYFETLRIPLISGRHFDARDDEGSAQVVILNESMARAHFGRTDPVGRRISISVDLYALRGAEEVQAPWFEIVGVVADSREYGMKREGTHTYYRPAAQAVAGPALLVAHQGDQGPLVEHLREVIHRMRPDLAIEGVETLASRVERDTAPSRLNATLFGSFAVLALIIAAVGVLASLAFSVSRRVREFGIRMAIGADRGSVLRRILGEGALLVAVALVAGVAASVLLGRFLSGLLFEVEPLDPTSMLAAGAVLGAAAMLASFVPALRATRIHPSEALRSE